MQVIRNTGLTQFCKTHVSVCAYEYASIQTDICFCVYACTITIKIPFDSEGSQLNLQ